MDLECPLTLGRLQCREGGREPLWCLQLCQCPRKEQTPAPLGWGRRLCPQAGGWRPDPPVGDASSASGSADPAGRSKHRVECNEEAADFLPQSCFLHTIPLWAGTAVFFFFFFFFFLPPANATATAMPDCVCDLYHIPLSEARDRTCIPMDTSQICFC